MLLEDASDLCCRNTVTGRQWKAEWFVGASSIYTFTYTTNPTISYVGLGRENHADANFSSFSLTVIPEPTTAALTGLLHSFACTTRVRTADGRKQRD